MDTDDRGRRLCAAVLSRIGHPDIDLAAGLVLDGSVSLAQACLQATRGGDRLDDVAFVNRLYSGLLGRGADPDGRAGHLRELESGRSSRLALIEGFLCSDEFQDRYTTPELAVFGPLTVGRPAESAIGVWARPQRVDSVDECHFYHVLDLPGVGVVGGEWDLRNGIDDYLGRTAVAGKRALDVGAASGFLSFALEQRGAEVVAYDLPSVAYWDFAPFDGAAGAVARRRDAHLGRIRKAFWFAHRALNSRVRLAQGSVYSFPREIGRFDVTVLGCILLHLRDPLLALQNAARVTSEAIVVTDLCPERDVAEPCLIFRPDPRTGEPSDTIWSVTPAAVRAFLGVLGFTDVVETRHVLRRADGMGVACFTVVGRRPSSGAPSARAAVW